MQGWISQGSSVSFPTIHILSDSTGMTAQALARAAAAFYEELNPRIELLPKIKDADQVLSVLREHYQFHIDRQINKPFIVFYTFIDALCSEAVEEFAAKKDDVYTVDVMKSALSTFTLALNKEPSPKRGSLRSVNEGYFKRIEAMEFCIEHDDGRNPQDLHKADIVLIGVSRSSKTPLSIYLSQMGYRVANVPLDPQTEPPKEIYSLDPRRVFGLIVAPEVLASIRKKRLGNALSIAGSYADLECVYQDLQKAHDLMRSLGCIVIRTDNRAIEETAQEILRYYEMTYPQL